MKNIVISQKKLDNLVVAGHLLSNCCFNLLSEENLNDDIKKSLKKCVEKWDKTLDMIIS